METETKPFDPWKSYPRRVIRRKTQISSFNHQSVETLLPYSKQLEEKKTQHEHTSNKDHSNQKKRKQ